jgi:uncharacterized protein
MTKPKVSENAESDYQLAQRILLRNVLSGESHVQNRETLGPLVPIHLFQALRMIALGSSLENLVGQGARALVFQAGLHTGQILGGAVAPAAGGNLDAFVEEVRKLCIALRIGVVSPTKVRLSHGELSLKVDECVSCAGIQGVSEPLCHFEAGLVGGIVRAFANKNVKAVESKCNAIGDSTCLVDVQFVG